MKQNKTQICGVVTAQEVLTETANKYIHAAQNRQIKGMIKAVANVTEQWNKGYTVNTDAGEKTISAEDIKVFLLVNPETVLKAFDSNAEVFLKSRMLNSSKRLCKDFYADKKE